MDWVGISAIIAGGTFLLACIKFSVPFYRGRLRLAVDNAIFWFASNGQLVLFFNVHNRSTEPMEIDFFDVVYGKGLVYPSLTTVEPGKRHLDPFQSQSLSQQFPWSKDLPQRTSLVRALSSPTAGDTVRFRLRAHTSRGVRKVRCECSFVHVYRF